jgi:hypothetical protein
MEKTSVNQFRLRQGHAYPSRQNSVAIFMLLVFFTLSALSVQGRDKTYDEPRHLQYGTNILNGVSARFDDSKMPFSAWNALPAKLGETVRLPEGTLSAYLPKLITARLMTTLFSMLVAFMIFHWSRELYGFVPALASLILYIFDPNIIAHSQLVTTDIYIAGMILFAVYWLWKFANHRTWQNGLCCAIMLGLAQLAKYTAVTLYPIFLLALIGYDFPAIRKAFETEGGRALAKSVLQYLKYALTAAVITILIINLGFLFNRSFTPLRDYNFRSDLFKSLQSRVSFVVPVPYPYLEGLDWIAQREHDNEGFGRIYLFGQTRFGQGFPGYYFAAALLKIPLATQIILIAAFIVYFREQEKRKRFLRDEWFLLLPILFYTIYFNFFYRAQIGIRHYLVVFPLLYVFAGGLFETWRMFERKQKLAAAALGLYLIVSVLSYYPYYISYFNEIIWDRKMAYKYLADSNIDWGQDRFILLKYRKEHPEVGRAPEIPTPINKTTRYFLYVNYLVGITRDPDTYRWLRENFEPIDTIAPSYLLFEITPEQMRELCDRTTYCKEN